MDDDDGHLEVQIQSVKEQIRSVEEQIQRVEEQIDRCPGNEERNLLRNKEALLRGEKAQILQGRDKCTEYDWLRQDLPSWDSGRCIKTPSTTQKERMHTPVNVEFWDVEGDIKGFLEKADRVKRRFQKVDNLTAITGRRNMHHVAGSIVACTCNFVSTKRLGSLVTYKTQARLSICLPEEGNSEEGNLENLDKSRSEDREVVKRLYYGNSPRADILVKFNDKDVAVLELKNGGLNVLCQSINFGQDAPGGQIQCNRISFDCWSVPVFMICQERSVVMPADMKAALLQTATPVAGATLALQKGVARSLLNCILQVYEYLVL